MRGCLYVYTCVYVHINVYTHVYLYTYTCLQISLYIIYVPLSHMPVHAYKYLGMCQCIYIYDMI